MSLGEAIAKAIQAHKRQINEAIDEGVCPDCGGMLEILSENVGFKDNPHTELSIVCTECKKDWTLGDLTEYPGDEEESYEYYGFKRRLAKRRSK